MCLWRTLTQGQRSVFGPYGGPDDVTAVDAVLMAQRLGLVEPVPALVPQPVLVTHRPLQVPGHQRRGVTGHQSIRGHSHCVNSLCFAVSLLNISEVRDTTTNRKYEPC